MKIRIRFAKRGHLRYIGHLDVMRYFQKAMRRAHVDIGYSQGFSPHQIMSFASPLGIGLTSEGEYLDIEVSNCGASAEMVRRLNEVMVEEIEIVSFRKLPDEGKNNAMATIAAADYLVCLKKENALSRDTDLAEWKRFLDQEEILLFRKTKKREGTDNIRPMILQAEWQEDQSFFLRLCAGSSQNLKPEAVMEAFFAFLGKEFSLSALQIHRLDLYGQKDGRYLSLEAFGEEIL
ncbi:TIGR03936 family radical SAM-associated protein [Hominifimenecus sp. rT4P-3]|uniref:TIGR03936 family radical SAM-associated protein n=1 Tax=Hominifimenecus sp. rT4P-3 TaxID=3242979 RepID=UPI003DA4F547